MNLTERQANIGLALLASSGAFVPLDAIARALNIPRPQIIPAINAIAHKLRSEPKQEAWIEHRNGFGFVLYGTGTRLAGFERQCLAAIADDAGTTYHQRAEDAKAASILAARATPLSLIGRGA